MALSEYIATFVFVPDEAPTVMVPLLISTELSVPFVIPYIPICEPVPCKSISAPASFITVAPSANIATEAFPDTPFAFIVITPPD